MFVSSGQFSVFIACYLYGAFSGLSFFVFNTLFFAIKNNVYKNVIDFFVMVIISISFVLFAKLRFTNRRMD